MATTFQNKVGVIRTKLAALISEKLLNVEVLPEDLNSQIPMLATPQNDCCSWDGYGRDKITKMNVHIYSYNTMSECVKHDIEVTEDDPCSFEILAKG
jgi:hypothetical protein